MPGESQQAPRNMPDPSVLTTEQLLREVESATELMRAELEGLRNVTAEQFRSLADKMALVETRRLEQKADTKTAVIDALTAQKEAVKEQTIASERAIAKSEAATTKQLEQLNATFATAFDGQRRDIDELKSFASTAGGFVRGGREQQAGVTTQVGFMIGGIGLLLTVVVIVVNIITSGP